MEYTVKMKDELIAWIDRVDEVYPSIEFNTIQMDIDGRYTVENSIYKYSCM